MLTTILKSLKQADGKCRMPEGRRSWCRYLRWRLHLSHVMEGLGRQRGDFCLPSQKHWARTGCQQHILYKDFLGRKFTEETDLIKVVKLFDRKSCTTSQATNNTSSSEKGAQWSNWQNTGPDVVNLIIHCHWSTKQSNYFRILDILRLFSCLLCPWQDENVAWDFFEWTWPAHRKVYRAVVLKIDLRIFTSMLIISSRPQTHTL